MGEKIREFESNATTRSVSLAKGMGTWNNEEKPEIPDDEDLNLSLRTKGEAEDIYSFLDKLENTPVTKKTRVLLTFPLRPQFIDRTVDLGLGYLYSSLRLEGYDVDLNMRSWKKRHFRKYLTENKVDVVGIKCYGSTTEQTIETINFIHSISPETTVLIGGPQIYGDPDNVLDYIPANFAFYGDCEEVLVEFLDRYFGHVEGDYHEVDGLIYRRERGKSVVNHLAVVKDLNRVPYPPWNRLPITIPRAVNYFYRYYPNAVMMRSRGCNMACRFCSNPFDFRERNVEHIIQEMKYLKKEYGVREFLFFDNNFNANRKHTRMICQRMIDEKINTPWYVTHGMRVNTVDKETVKLMSEAGLTRPPKSSPNVKLRFL